MWIARRDILLSCMVVATLLASDVRAHADTPAERWEYGELRHHERSGTVVEPEKKFMSSIEWTSAEGFVRGYGWERMGDVLKSPVVNADEPRVEKKDVSESLHRIRVLNHLGRQGWEMISTSTSDERGSSIWTFKRLIRE